MSRALLATLAASPMPQQRSSRRSPTLSVARRAVLALCLAVAACGDGDDGAAPTSSLEGSYVLVEENGQTLPSDPQGLAGCCLTLDGTLALGAGTYVLRTTHQSKDQADVISRNMEEGTWRADGRLLRFTRTRGSDANQPYLLGAGSAAPDGRTVVLLYGDEGPGSDQIRATFRRP